MVAVWLGLTRPRVICNAFPLKAESGIRNGGMEWVGYWMRRGWGLPEEGNLFDTERVLKDRIMV